ncbi:MAG: Gfo/Idh/MocA family oxidoreductase [Bryobacteraceae bacterium]
MIELRDELGEPCAVNVCLYHDARPYDFKGWWTRASQCGGTLDIAGVHTIDWMRAICGDVSEVSASAGRESTNDTTFRTTSTYRFGSSPEPWRRSPFL